MHLSKNTIDLYGETINDFYNNEQYIISKKLAESPHKSISVKRGDIIGFVGKRSENGGWSTHTHVEIHFSSLMNSNFSNFKKIDKWFIGKINALYGKGTYVDAKVKEGNDSKNNIINNFEAWSIYKGIINPNNIYKFFDDKTIVKISKV